MSGNNQHDQHQQPERKRPGKTGLIILAVVVIMLIVGLWFWLSTPILKPRTTPLPEAMQ